MIEMKGRGGRRVEQTEGVNNADTTEPVQRVLGVANWGSVGTGEP
jgi:hypothetical protein